MSIMSTKRKKNLHKLKFSEFVCRNLNLIYLNDCIYISSLVLRTLAKGRDESEMVKDDRPVRCPDDKIDMKDSFEQEADCTMQAVTGMDKAKLNEDVSHPSFCIKKKIYKFCWKFQSCMPKILPSKEGGGYSKIEIKSIYLTHHITYIQVKKTKTNVRIK